MVVRTVMLAIGVVELLFPRRMVDFWMNLATESGDVTLRPWVYTAARVEGVVILVWLLARGRRRPERASDESSQ
ncbi:hypothetical protein [Halorussus caseinilyticus]|uniref:Uncharacterized protein n=1 Tax=Halorussus caseinilyticus TaxID=3034025 RepID=A0ABD5WK52_9EURY|nr:hypothetical protein [Halorussus sp. DT72]